MPTRKVQEASNATGTIEPRPATEAAPVEVRPGATVSPETVNVFQEAVSPGTTSKVRLARLGGRPAGDAIALSVLAWVRNIAFDKDVWIDLYLETAGEPVHAETLPLTFQEPADGGGDFFAVGAAIPAGRAGAGATLSYRVYGQMGGRLFTDGILHTYEIPAVAPAKPAAAKTTAPAEEAKPAKPAANTRTKPAPSLAASEKPAAAAKPRKPKAPKAPKA